MAENQSPSVDSGKIKAKVRNLRNLERIGSLLMRHDPSEYVPLAARKLAWVLENTAERGRYWPPHFLLHSMELCCAVHRRGYAQPITEERLRKIIRAYQDLEAPTAEWLLPGDQPFERFFAALKRQQLRVQYGAGEYDLARSLFVFGGEGRMKRSQRQFVSATGLTFDQWVFVCWQILLGCKANRSVRWPKANLMKLTRWVSEEALERALDQLSCSPEQVREEYERIHAAGRLQYDPFLPSVFFTRPLFRVSDDEYVVIHMGSIARRSWEAIAEFCTQDSGNEMGRSFEAYVRKVLGELSVDRILLTQKQLKRRVQGDVCDAALLDPEWSLLIEAKTATSVTDVPSESALVGHGSTSTVLKAVGQISSTAHGIAKGAVDKICPGVSRRPIVGAVVTLGELDFPNSRWYWDHVLQARAVCDGKPGLPGITHMAAKPQIVDATDFEQLVLSIRDHGIDPVAEFQKKEATPEHRGTDWKIYLYHLLGETPGGDIAVLKETVDAFYQKCFPSDV